MKLIIPSRNRPSSLRNVLYYMYKFYPEMEIILADGSDNSYKKEYKRIVKDIQNKINIKHYSYHSELPIATRITKVLEKFDDELFIVGADDDYPLIEVFLEAESFLKNNLDYKMAIGGTIGLRLLDNNEAQAKLLYSRTIEQNSPIERINHFSKWPYPTTYALVRREHYINRIKWADFGVMPGFGDFTMGFHDCIGGKIKAIDKICYFQTTNKVHSNIRRKNNLFYIENAKNVLATKKHYKDILLQIESVTEARAEQISTRLVNTRVAELITPAKQNTKGFGNSELFKEKENLAQYRNFENIFKVGSANREQVLPQFKMIIKNMIELESSNTDNLKEPKVYSSYNEMKRKS